MVPRLPKEPRGARVVVAVVVLLSLLACGKRSPGPVSERSFDDIDRLVRGKSAADVETLLGPPDTRQTIFDGDERWIWWSYTFLDGPDHPPELRGRTVHLEMVFRRPGAGSDRSDRSLWVVDEALSPAYRLPADEDSALEYQGARSRR